MTDQPRVFLTYSWESERHKRWVAKLATRLRDRGVNLRFDQWHNQIGPISLFVEQECRAADVILPIVTPSYVVAADDRQGAAGREASLISARQMRGDRFACVPVFVRNPGRELPWFLEDSAGFQLSTRPTEAEIDQLVILISAAASLDGDEIPPGRRQPTRDRRRSMQRMLAIAAGAAVLVIATILLLTQGGDDPPDAGTTVAPPLTTNTDTTSAEPRSTAAPTTPAASATTVGPEPTTVPSTDRPNTTEVPETTDGPASTTTTTEPEAQTGEALIGVWEGDVRSGDGSDPFQAVVVVGPEPNDVRWSVGFGACSGDVDDVSVSTTGLEGEPSITTGRDNCSSGRRLTLALSSDDTVEYEWSSTDDASTTTGTLERWEEIDPVASVAWPTRRSDLPSTFSLWLGTCVGGGSPPCPPTGLLPRWSTCSGGLCAVGFADDDVQLFDQSPYSYLKRLDASARNATVELILQGVSPSSAMEMVLAP